jgi:hypothetical protein
MSPCSVIALPGQGERTGGGSERNPVEGSVRRVIIPWRESGEAIELQRIICGRRSITDPVAGAVPVVVFPSAIPSDNRAGKLETWNDGDNCRRQNDLPTTNETWSLHFWGERLFPYCRKPTEIAPHRAPIPSVFSKSGKPESSPLACRGEPASTA